MNMNYIRVATAIPKVEVANVRYNVERIVELSKEAKKKNVEILVFPELSLTGYTCGDLFHTSTTMTNVRNGIALLKRQLPEEIIVIVGAPTEKLGKFYNSAIIFYNGNIIGTENKTYLPGYKEFYEERWFSGNEEPKNLYRYGDTVFGIEICEDVWAPEPPSNLLVKRGADIIFNLSASNELIGKHDYLISLLKQQSARLISGYVYASSGYGESSQDLVYAGNGIILENGKILKESERFSMSEQLVVADIDIEALRNERKVNTTFQAFLNTVESDPIVISKSSYYIKDRLERHINPYPFKGDDNRYKEILNIQSHALAKRLEHTGMKPVIGISGGSDSTWALIVILEAMKKLGMDANEIIGVSMPGFATSNRTRTNAMKLMEYYGINSREIDITEICTAELKALGHTGEQDITYENVQARTRTQILMNIANKEGGLVIGTGDLSELALGWCTYNADHMSMYGVNVSVPKTLIKNLIRWYSNEENEILVDILNTPVSPELIGTGAEGDNPQVTEDNIGPYEVHDFILYNFLRHGFSPEKILFLAEQTELKKYDLKKWINVFFKRFFQQQFKRSCLPDGPKIGSISLSPRGDWRMPSDASYKLWQLD